METRMSTRVDTAEQFLANPCGRYLAGEGYFYGCSADQQLYYTILFGRPGVETLRQLVKLFAAEPRGVKPHVSLFDLSMMDIIDPESMSVVTDYVRMQRDELKAKIRRQAVVYPPGVNGAVVRSYPSVVPFPYEVAMFGDRMDALDWLGCSAEAAQHLESLATLAVGGPVILRALRATFVGRLPVADLESSAHLLGMSSRSLQRALNHAGSSFRDELAGERIRRAQEMLRDTNAKTASIAMDIGCASPQHFSTLFRRHVGQSPSVWRRQARTQAIGGGLPRLELNPQT